jgi:alpha-D-ribose 1-methylphosphonate 5-triphosphate synthase subunit PhnH
MQMHLEGGFADAPRDAAHAFRAAMNAMARPGTIIDIGGTAPPAPLSVAAGTLILTLCDPGTPLHVAVGHDLPAVRDWITFHTGAPFAGPGDCAFALGAWDALGALDQYPAGTPEYPDRSATLIVEMPALEAAGEILSGPGIRDKAVFNLPAVLPFRHNAERFPLGLDFFFTCGAQIAALPRSTRINKAGGMV